MSCSHVLPLVLVWIMILCPHSFEVQYCFSIHIAHMCCVVFAGLRSLRCPKMALVKSKHGRCRTIRTCSCPGCDNCRPKDAAPLMGWRCSPVTTSTTTTTTATTTTTTSLIFCLLEWERTGRLRQNSTAAVLMGKSTSEMSLVLRLNFESGAWKTVWNTFPQASWKRKLRRLY